jgi:REP-associated tyrosine transposase
MPRLPRYSLPGVPQHVIQRGHNRQPIFFQEDDYRFYLTCLQETTARHATAVHAYVLMTNHVHVLMTPHQPHSIAKVMQALGRRYVPYINATYQRTGTLWEGRYRASLVDADRYLLACYRYIELNPVRAGMVQHPTAYPWSSYRWHACGQHDPVITDHTLYLALGSTVQARHTAYQVLCQHPDIGTYFLKRRVGKGLCPVRVCEYDTSLLSPHSSARLYRLYATLGTWPSAQGDRRLRLGHH